MQQVKSIKSRNAIKFVAISLINTPVTAIFAHDLQDGNGITGAHWHSSDVIGFVALAAIIALTLWFSRGDK